MIYKNVYGSYFHGRILARNEHLAERLIRLSLEQRYGKDLDLPTLQEALA